MHQMFDIGKAIKYEFVYDCETEMYAAIDAIECQISIVCQSYTKLKFVFNNYDLSIECNMESARLSSMTSNLKCRNSDFRTISTILKSV